MRSQFNSLLSRDTTVAANFRSNGYDVTLWRPIAAKARKPDSQTSQCRQTSSSCRLSELDSCVARFGLQFELKFPQNDRQFDAFCLNANQSLQCVGVDDVIGAVESHVVLFSGFPAK
ncbi:unnamed protein product [Oppiella nova]|uniref:Uncharacterized protein n=1 Tax=Oppiella nova TaxID=334625 RepID=A0A7R9QNU9_9ACAR|nr:unnamed protein product [Oppiella nova]CAG2169967.1 unnamed protein product [Oppiella nova]